jgi:hypothetical protein
LGEAEDFLRAVEDGAGAFSAASEGIFSQRCFASFAGRL